jgi:hypothetical protein
MDEDEMTTEAKKKQVKTECRPTEILGGLINLNPKWNGPRTAEGKQRIAQAQLKHGFYSKAGLEAKHAESIQLRQLEDIAVLIGMITGPKTRGCKPQGYRQITSMEAVKALVALK